MSPALTFFSGLLLLILLGWYFATDLPGRKRWLGLVLTVLLVAFCLEEAFPPAKKIPLGLDLQGGVLLDQMTPQGDQAITTDLLDQAVEVIRKRVDAYGVSEPVSLRLKATTAFSCKFRVLTPSKSKRPRLNCSG